MAKRLDVLLTEKYGIQSRSKAQNLIKQNLVLVDGKPVKASSLIDENQKVEILEHDNFVSRGAYKLLGAIENFNIDLNGKVVLDVGASTGGFTQVALQNGANKVYALDVGKGELDKTLAQDPRVVNMESTDIRKLKKESVVDVNMVVGDLSFISLTKVLPTIKGLFGNIQTMFLFKPQFECGKEIAKKYKGVIKDKNLHIKLLNEFVEYTNMIGFPICDIVASPIKGGDGNIEYLLHFNKDKKYFNIKNIVEKAFEK